MCGRRFTNRNQWHSCGHFSIEDHLIGTSPQVRKLFEAFHNAVEECGPVELAPTKTRIGFQVRMIFAAVMLRKAWLSGHLILSRRIESPRFTRIESLSPKGHVHHFKLRSLEEIDDEFKMLLREAYLMGRQDHIAG